MILLFRWNYLLLFSMCLSIINTSAQKNITAYDSLGKATLFMQQEELYQIQADTHHLLFSVKGNIIFSNQSQQREDILYLITGNDIFSKKGGQIISAANNKAIFTFTKGKLFLGNTVFDKRMLLGQFQIVNNQMSFQCIAQTRPLFYIDSNDASAASLLAIAVCFIQLQEIDVKHFTQLQAQQSVVEGTGTIRRLWGNNNSEDFIWDGRILRKRWNANEFDQWKFDGNTITRAFFDTGEDWQWDGTTLQSRWNRNEQAYIWQGNTLKSLYGNEQAEYFIQGNIIKRAWNAVGNDEWEVNGSIPIPILMMVVFRIVK